MTHKPARYRTPLRIYVDILRVIQREGGEAKPTRILYGANLSHDRLTRYIEQMKAKELLEEASGEEHVTYRITEKGVNLLREFAKVEEFMDAFGIPI